MWKVLVRTIIAFAFSVFGRQLIAFATAGARERFPGRRSE
jgi:hypothetical protein